MAKCVLTCPVARYAITKKPKNPWTFLVEAARRDRTEGSTVVKQALRQLEPDVVKNLLLNHARRCKREHCPTCMKLKNRIAVVKRVKRRQELWRARHVDCDAYAAINRDQNEVKTNDRDPSCPCTNTYQYVQQASDHQRSRDRRPRFCATFTVV